jgi:proline racemase
VTSGAVFPSTIRVVDSHTEGEPTRVVIDGWPQPAGRTMAERLAYMRARQDHLRSAVVCEPRGHDAVVGVLLVPPVEQGSVAGVVFFNNGTWLGMCGHGLIGVVRTLQHLGRLAPGAACFDTPVGTVSVELAKDGTVTITNVPAHVHAREVNVSVPGYGLVTGDIAWGGNWFFITHAEHVPVELSHVDALTRFTRAIQDALRSAGITGANGGDIDHIEISAAPLRSDADCLNYVLCSGGEYDRSPCGTGTSAKMAALHARGELAIGEKWRQEGIAGGLIPHISGTAFVTAEATLFFDERDPFHGGIRHDPHLPPLTRD